MKKKLLGLILAVAIGFSVLPSTTVYATEPEIQQTENNADENAVYVDTSNIWIYYV